LKATVRRRLCEIMQRCSLCWFYWRRLTNVATAMQLVLGAAHHFRIHATRPITGYSEISCLVSGTSDLEKSQMCSIGKIFHDH
jgi:hypothetical protein